MMPVLKLDVVVRGRHSNSATTRPETCCSSDQNLQDLSIIPAAVLEADRYQYDLSAFVQSGDSVLILGCRAGKTAFLASQTAGVAGHVVGVEPDDQLLSIARTSLSATSKTKVFERLAFRKGVIHDLKLDHEQLDRLLHDEPATSSAAWLRVNDAADRLRETAPLIADSSMTLVLGDCEFTALPESARTPFFNEIFRVLEIGGRCVIRVLVSNRDRSIHDTQGLEWSEAPGVFHAEELFSGLETAGFGGIEIVDDALMTTPKAGSDVRSLIVRAYKLSLNCCAEWDGSNATEVIYRGPWKAVVDDAGHTFARGHRMSVCATTATLLRQSPYSGQMLFASGAMAELPESECGKSGENYRSDRCC